jgi:hypothetical protein
MLKGTAMSAPLLELQNRKDSTSSATLRRPRADRAPDPAPGRNYPIGAWSIGLAPPAAVAPRGAFGRLT